jgi:hypothetical protein
MKMKSNCIGPSVVPFLMALVCLSGCGAKEPGQAKEPLPDIDCICVMPARVLSSEPRLEDSDREAIRFIVQEEVAAAVSGVIPADTRLVRVSEEMQTDECEALLATDVAFLQLVEKEDTAKSAAATAAGVALMAVTGVGFFTVPSARMSVNLTLTDHRDGAVLWSATEQVSAPSLSVRENYAGQVRSMTGPLQTRVKNKFPVRARNRR